MINNTSKKHGRAWVSTLLLLSSSSLVHAGDIELKLQRLAAGKLPQILEASVVVDSIKEQNAKHESLTQGDIDSLDKKWRAETSTGGGSLTDKTLATPLSKYLIDVAMDNGGLISEVFVMDNRGLNVGQSGLTSDYWQGDESKWIETYGSGEQSVHISDIEFDESSQTYTAQVSVSISDPETNRLIGAATFGVDADALEYVSMQELD